MPNMQTINLMGHLGKDAEVKTSKAGRPYTQFSIAANHRDRDGDDVTTWYNITTFGKAGEICGEWRKGNAVYLSGDLKPRTYEKSDGTTGTSLDVIATTVKNLTPRDKGDSPTSSRSSSSAVDDLPF